MLEFRKIRMRGILAWFAWIVVHVYYLIGFRSRTLVMFEWFWAYVANRRGARLITNLRPLASTQKKPSVDVQKKAERADKAGWNTNAQGEKTARQ